MKLLSYIVLAYLGILLKTQFGRSHMILTEVLCNYKHIHTRNISWRLHNKTKRNLTTTILHLEVYSADTYRILYELHTVNMREISQYILGCMTFESSHTRVYRRKIISYSTTWDYTATVTHYRSHTFPGVNATYVNSSHLCTLGSLIIIFSRICSVNQFSDQIYFFVTTSLPLSREAKITSGTTHTCT